MYACLAGRRLRADGWCDVGGVGVAFASVLYLCMECRETTIVTGTVSFISSLLPSLPPTSPPPSLPPTSPPPSLPLPHRSDHRHEVDFIQACASGSACSAHSLVRASR